MNVSKIFIVAGTFIGFIGTSLGCLLGLLITTNIEKIRKGLESLTDVKLFEPAIYFLKNLPVALDIDTVIMITLISLFLSFLASIYPAWKAAKLMPAKVLRYE